MFWNKKNGKDGSTETEAESKVLEAPLALPKQRQSQRCF